VLILQYPVRALTSTTIVLPSRFDRHSRNDGSRPVTLDAIARTYIRRIRPRAQTEIDWFIPPAIASGSNKNAALAVNSRANATLISGA